MIIPKLKNNNLLRKMNVFSAIVFFVSSLTLFSSCHKNEGLSVGLVDPTSEYAHREVTFSNFKSYTTTDDTLPSDENSCVGNFLGRITADDFGYMNASFATQFSVPSTDIDIKDLTTNSVSSFDSVKLTLAYKSADFYGDLTGITNAFRVQVFKITTPITATRTYYCNTKFASVADTTQLLADTTLNLLQASENSVTFKLLASAFNNLLSDSAFAFASTELLKSKFYGLGIRVYNPAQPAGSGGIVSFLLTDDITKLDMYYHTSANASKTVSLNVNSSCRRINMYESNATNRVATLAADTSNLYLQSFGAYNGKVEVDFSSLFKDSLPVAIAQAQLVFQVNNLKLSSSQTKPYSNYLKVYYYDDNLVTHSFLIDELQTEAFAPSGIYNSTTQTYSVNITRTLQNYLNGNTNIKGFLVTCDSRNNAYRKVIIKGGSNIKLNIKYTKFK